MSHIKKGCYTRELEKDEHNGSDLFVLSPTGHTKVPLNSIWVKPIKIYFGTTLFYKQTWQTAGSSKDSKCFKTKLKYY